MMQVMAFLALTDQTIVFVVDDVSSSVAKCGSVLRKEVSRFVVFLLVCLPKNIFIKLIIFQKWKRMV